MYCSECGEKLEYNDKFCSNCGAPISNDKLEFLRKNKNVICGIGVVAVVIVLLLVIISSASSSPKIYGTWAITSDTFNLEYFGEYPDNRIVIKDDGTFITDEITGTYYIYENTAPYPDIITFNSYYNSDSYSYEFELKRNTLKLKSCEYSGAPEISYERVS